MIVKIEQKQPLVPISSVLSITYTHGGCMITIGQIPKKLQGFFRPVKKQVSGHVYDYFWSFVLAMCVSHGSTIDRLVHHSVVLELNVSSYRVEEAQKRRNIDP